MVSALLGGNMIIEIHINLISTAEITESWNTQLQNKSLDIRTSPKGSAKSSRWFNDFPKTSSGDTFYTVKLPINRKEAVTRIHIYVYTSVYMYT